MNPTLAVSCKIFLFSMNYRKASTITQLISDSPCACKLFCHLDSQTKDWRHGVRSRNLEGSLVQTILCQKLLFLYQLTHNMTTDCTLNYEFSTWKFQDQTMLCTKHFLKVKTKNNLCTEHFLSLEQSFAILWVDFTRINLLKSIYLYIDQNYSFLSTITSIFFFSI